MRQVLGVVSMSRKVTKRRRAAHRKLGLWVECVVFFLCVGDFLGIRWAWLQRRVPDLLDEAAMRDIIRHMLSGELTFGQTVQKLHEIRSCRRLVAHAEGIVRSERSKRKVSRLPGTRPLMLRSFHSATNCW